MECGGMSKTKNMREQAKRKIDDNFQTLKNEINEKEHQIQRFITHADEINKANTQLYSDMELEIIYLQIQLDLITNYNFDPYGMETFIMRIEKENSIESPKVP